MSNVEFVITADFMLVRWRSSLPWFTSTSPTLLLGAVRRRTTFDGGSVDANDHPLRGLIGFSIFGDLLSNLF